MSTALEIDPVVTDDDQSIKEGKGIEKEKGKRNQKWRRKNINESNESKESRFRKLLQSLSIISPLSSQPPPSRTESGSTSEIRERAAHVFLRKLRNNRYSGNKDSSSKKSKSYTGGEGPLSHDIIHESNTKIANDENK